MPRVSASRVLRWAASRAPRKSATSATTSGREAIRKARQIPWKDRDHALFLAFAPVGAPRYVCAMVVEHGGNSGGGGSAVAAPICRDILLEVQRRDPARRVPGAEAVAQVNAPGG